MNDVLAVMQDDWVMMALPFFFGALFIEVIWAYRSHTQHYESVDFWTSMRVMLLTVFVDLIPKFLGISLMFVAYSVSPLKVSSIPVGIGGFCCSSLTTSPITAFTEVIMKFGSSGQGMYRITAPSTTTLEQRYARASASASSNTRSGCRWRYLATTQP